MIKELEQLRRRYPAYQDVDDLTLATALVKKYPEYRSTLEKAMRQPRAGMPKTPASAKKDLYGLWGAEKLTPEEERRAGKIAGIPAPYFTAASETLKEGLGTPLLHFLNMAAFNLPRAVAAKQGYKYPEAKTMPGQLLSRGAGLAGAITSPVTKAIMGAKLPTISKAPVKEMAAKGAIRGGALGAAYTPTDAEDLVALPQRATQALVGSAVGGAMGAVSGGVKQALLRKGQKVKQIKDAFRKWSREESKVYGQMEKDLGKTGEKIDPIESLEWMEQKLFERGLIDETGARISKAGASKVDRGLYKAYTNLLDDYANATGGKVGVGKVIRAGRQVKAAGGKRVRFKPTEAGREASSLKQEFMETLKPKIRGPKFEAMQRRYHNYKKDFDIVDRHFNIWDSEHATGKGERALSRLARSAEMLKVADIIKRQTGMNITPDLVASFVSNPAFRQLARDVGFVGAVWYMAKRRMEGGGTTAGQGGGTGY